MPGSLAVLNQAAATSGDYLQSFTSDYARLHIVDPRTGFSNPELASATVVHPRAAVADALATACMVLGVAVSMKLAQSVNGCEALLVTKDLQKIQAPNFPTR